MKHVFVAAILLSHFLAFGQQKSQTAQPSADAVSTSLEDSSEDSWERSWEHSWQDEQQPERFIPPQIVLPKKDTTCTKSNGDLCPEWLHKLIGQYPPAAQPSNLLHTPLPQRMEKAGFWSFRGLGDPALRTNSEVFHDKTLLGTEGFWLGSIVYDAELTHQGLAHHKCVEASNLIDDPHPGRGELYAWAVPEFAAGTALNYLMIRFVGKPLILETAGIASTSHLRGGSRWLTNCW